MENNLYINSYTLGRNIVGYIFSRAMSEMNNVESFDMYTFVLAVELNFGTNVVISFPYYRKSPSTPYQYLKAHRKRIFQQISHHQRTRSFGPDQ